MAVCSIPYGREAIPVKIPEGWKVKTVKYTGASLTREHIEEILMNPAGTLPIRNIALEKKAKTAAIILEDHTRFTPLSDVLEIILRELNAAGIPDSSIIMIGATAAHRTMHMEDFRKKIGGKLTERVRVIPHMPKDRDSLACIGTTSYGNRVYVNKEAAACDIKLAVGGIAPHGMASFGGGAKLILPGICGIDTIKYNHTQVKQKAAIAFGSFEERPTRLDMEEAARMLGVDFIAAGLIDFDLNLVGLVAGDLVKAHRMGAERASKIYTLPVEEPADVVVACSYPFDVDYFQACKALFPCMPFVRKGGVVIWASACPEGAGTHMLTQGFDDYNENMLKGLENVYERASTVIFASGGIDYKDIEKYIPSKVLFCSELQDAFDRAARLKPGSADMTVLHSSPLTIGI